MAITSKGYTGSVDNVDWAVLSDKLGARFAVFGADSFRVTKTTGDRAVSIRAGEASGQGIRDLSDSAVTLTGAPVASGSRYDLVALRRNWNTRTSTLVLIQGNASYSLPSARRDTVGDIVDHPLALVQFSAGQTAAQDVIDLRVWHGDGSLVANSFLAREFLDRIGTTVHIGLTTWLREFTATGLVTWTEVDKPVAFQAAGIGLAGIDVPDAYGIARLEMKTGQMTDTGFIRNGAQSLVPVLFQQQFSNRLLSVQLTQLQQDGAAAAHIIAIDGAHKGGFGVVYPGETVAVKRSFLWTAVGY